MIIYKYPIYALLFICSVLFFHQIAKAQEQLPINPEQQQGANDCWAACCKMIIDYYEPDNTVSYDEIWEYGTPGYDDPTGLCTAAPGYHSCQQILWNFITESSYCDETGSLFFNNIRDEIDAERPIISRWDLKQVAGNHAVLIVGYEDGSTDYVYYCDPADADNVWSISYSLFCEDDYAIWNGSLLMWYAPEWVGILSYVEITSGPTSFSHPASACSYTGVFTSMDYPPCVASSWNWSLIFFHEAGEYTAATETNSGHPYFDTLNVAAFSLPGGYAWYRNEEGMVMGTVKVHVVDSDGYPHDYILQVTYALPPLIPNGIILHDEVISTPWADILAHHCIIANNVTVQAGGSIALRAGSCVTISDNVSVANGATFTVQVDPSLQ